MAGLSIELKSIGVLRLDLYLLAPIVVIAELQATAGCTAQCTQYIRIGRTDHPGKCGVPFDGSYCWPFESFRRLSGVFKPSEI